MKNKQKKEIPVWKHDELEFKKAFLKLSDNQKIKMLEYLKDILYEFGWVFREIELLDDSNRLKDKSDAFKLGYLLAQIEKREETIYTLTGEVGCKFKRFIIDENYILRLKLKIDRDEEQ